VEVGKEVKVYVFPADLGGCGYYRLIWPAQELQRQGHQIEIVFPRQRDQLLQAKLDGNERVVSVRLPQDADVVVFQRLTHRYMVQAVPIIRASGVAVVIDMDDDLTCIHPSNPAFHTLHPTNPATAYHSWQNTQVACEAATMVTVSTPTLLDRYARRTAGHVLYNAVPARYLKIEHEDSDVVGWAGSVHSHPTDLQVMGSAVAQLLQNGHTFKVAGPEQGIHKALGVPTSFKIETTGIVQNIETWPLAVNTIGIGVAPLADSRFNASKSWLKPLEYAAVGVPCVVSPRIEYSRLAKQGVGIPAKTPQDWRRKLQVLINDPLARTELSERGRLAASNHTIEKNAWRWLEAWTAALENQRYGTLTSLGRT
jgi:glycosyltransferase involved in cell wall biosynthesis